MNDLQSKLIKLFCRIIKNWQCCCSEELLYASRVHVLFRGYICKPQTSQYEMMPEVEDLTMHLAEVARIEVVPHTCSEELLYASRVHVLFPF